MRKFQALPISGCCLAVWNHRKCFGLGFFFLFLVVCFFGAFFFLGRRKKKLFFSSSWSFDKMLLCIQSTCENRDATAEEWKGYYTWGIKIALWTDTRTDFRKENKYLCVLEKEKRIPCMKCVKSALAHAPWRIRSSHYNSPSLCAHVFPPPTPQCPALQKCPGLKKSNCPAIAVPGLLPGEGKAAPGCLQLLPGEQLWGSPPSPHRASPHLRDMAPEAAARPCQSAAGPEQKAH